MKERADVLTIPRRRSGHRQKSAASQLRPQIACVIPAFNEEKTVGDVVNQVKAYCDLVIVVDDGSKDETAGNAAKMGARVVSHPFNLGAGAAVSTGLALAVRAGATRIVTLDADGQHNVAELPMLLRPIVEGEADLVIGSRKRAGSPGMPFYKRFGNAVLAFLASSKSGVRITDSETGFRAMTRVVAENLRPNAMGYSYASEMIVRATQHSYRVVEIPIRTIYPRGRTRGTSLMDGLRIALRTITMGGK